MEIMFVKILNMLVVVRIVEVDNFFVYFFFMYKWFEIVDVREFLRVYGYVVIMRLLFGRRYIMKENVFFDEGRLG